MNILSVALALTTLFSVISAASEIKEVRNKRIVEFKDLVNAAYLNGTHGLVLADANEDGRYPTMTVRESEVLNFTSSKRFSPAKYFQTVLVKPANITDDFEWNKPRERSINEILNNIIITDNIFSIGSNWDSPELTADQKRELDKVSNLIMAMTSDNPANILDDGETETMARVLGIWICQKYGHAGMVHVADKNGDFTEYLARAWDYIGVWMA